MWLHAKKGRLILLALIASLAFNAGVGATFGVRTYQRYAERDCDGPRGGRLFESLNLTEEQSARVDEMRSGMREEFRGLRASLAEENRQLAELMTAELPDRAAINARIKVISLMHERMQTRLVEHFLDIREVLEPDQIEAFNEMIVRVLSHGGPGRGGPGRGGHGRGDRPHGKGAREHGPKPTEDNGG